MTLENLQKRLAVTTDPSEKKIIEKKIAERLESPKFAHLKTKPVEEKKETIKKSK